MIKIDKRRQKLEELHKLQKDNERMDLTTFNKLTANFSYSDSALLWFQLNLNQIVTSEELAQIHGKNTGQPISHNIRRIFELRDEKGYDLINHKTKKSLNDNPLLIPGTFSIRNALGIFASVILRYSR